MEEYEEDIPEVLDQSEGVEDIPVKVIAGKAGISLVEYMAENETLERVYVPTDSIGTSEDVSTFCKADILAYGSPYGVPWAEMVDSENLVLDPYRLERELRRHNIWTVNDFLQSPQAVRAAVNQALSDIFSTVRAKALQFESSEGA